MYIYISSFSITYYVILFNTFNDDYGGDTNQSVTFTNQVLRSAPYE